MLSCNARDGARSQTGGQAGRGMTVARIDLYNVSKTLTESAAFGTWGRGRRTTLAVRDLTLRVPDGQTRSCWGPAAVARRPC
jgi:hypothetical protein